MGLHSTYIYRPGVFHFFPSTCLVPVGLKKLHPFAPVGPFSSLLLLYLILLFRDEYHLPWWMRRHRSNSLSFLRSRLFLPFARRVDLDFLERSRGWRLHRTSRPQLDSENESFDPTPFFFCFRLISVYSFPQWHAMPSFIWEKVLDFPVDFLSADPSRILQLSNSISSTFPLHRTSFSHSDPSVSISPSPISAQQSPSKPSSPVSSTPRSSIEEESDSGWILSRS